eukprot:2957437-Prorocentrum_lima.AAC.1
MWDLRLRVVRRTFDRMFKPTGDDTFHEYGPGCLYCMWCVYCSAENFAMAATGRMSGIGLSLCRP